MTDRELLEQLVHGQTEMKGQLTGLENRMSGMETRMSGIEERVSGIEERVSGIETTITEMKGDIHELGARMNKAENHIANIRLTLENETNHNLRVVAENHITLYEKLNEALKQKESDLEYKLRVNTLDWEVKQLKARFA